MGRMCTEPPSASTALIAHADGELVVVFIDIPLVFIVDLRAARGQRTRSRMAGCFDRSQATGPVRASAEVGTNGDCL